MSQTSETRSFQFSDDKSDKFWTITLEDTQHTVHYGRTGTQGQQQTKEFPTAEKARQSYEKLIREKLSKGYVESGEQVPASGFAVTAKVTPTAKKSKAAPVEEAMVPVATSEETTAPSVVESAVSPTVEQHSKEFEVGRSLNLAPEDWFWATWRSLTPLQRPPVKPFDLQQALKQLTRVTTNELGWGWDWSKANISVSLSKEEAHFWLNAITQAHNQITPEQLAEQLSTQSFTGNVSPESCYELLLHQSHERANGRISLIVIVAQRDSQEICLALFNLFSTEQFIDFLFYIEKQIAGMIHGEKWAWQEVQANLTNTFQKYILPYLTQEKRIELKRMMEKQLDLSQWPTDHYAKPSPLFHLAACLGCEVLEQLVEGWADDFYKHSGWRVDYYHRPQEVIFGLKSSERVQAHMRRLKLPLYFPDQPSLSGTYLRAWLAHTEFSALDYVGNTVLDITNKKDAEAFIKDFASTVQAPEIAPVMLELMLSSKAPSVSRQWLQEHPKLAIAGLIPLIGQRRLGKAPTGRLTEAAVNWLRSLKRQGYEPTIRACLEQQPEEVAERVRQTVLEFQEKEYTPFDDRTTPEWLQQALSTLPEKSAKKKAGWTIVLADLPAIALDDYCLNDAQLEAVLSALRQSKLDSPHPFVTAVKAHCDRTTLDTFAWKLFELWLTEGAPSKENWAMMAVGFLGADVSALKLAPLIREWPGESQHQRAVMGLECLRTIGTDTALMQINGIAQKVKFKGIKQRAQECMEAIAQDRNMTREQLEDRIVPDCDLDERGTCMFDFGARQFRFVLGADLKPMVKDGEGKVKPNLPNPGAKDDSEKAEGAIAHWKLLKKQVSEVVKIQTLRLEQAMVTGRRWQVDEFTTLLVKHPLMTHLVQRLIWGCYNADGELTATFRVTEDQTCANENDETFDISGVTQIGIVHPLHLPTEVRSAWGELLSDYEIVQPFQQLGRSLHGLEPEEETQKAITRFDKIQVPAVALVGMLERSGWMRGIPQDGGVFFEHSKAFHGANVTAIVEYDGVPVGYMDGWDNQSIQRCFFIAGVYRPKIYPDHERFIPLGKIDPVVISEVLGDLITITVKAQ